MENRITKQWKRYTLKLKNAKNVTWKSQDKKIAKISAKGKVTAVKEGSTKVYAVYTRSDMMEAMNEGVTYTTEYIYNLPDGQRAELIDGQIYSMSPPSFRHQKMLVELFNVIHNYIKTNNGLCEVLPAPFAVFLNQDDKTYVEPDISVICDKKKLDDRGCNGAPDWIIEIVLPGSKRMDYFIKLFKYRTAGVREYWIVDIQKETVMVYDFDGETMEQYTFADKIKAAIYTDFEIDFSKINEMLTVN